MIRRLKQERTCKSEATQFERVRNILQHMNLQIKGATSPPPLNKAAIVQRAPEETQVLHNYVRSCI